MWSPADLFVGGLTPFLVAGRRFMTFFYERPMGLLFTMCLLGTFFFVVETLASVIAARHARRTEV